MKNQPQILLKTKRNGFCDTIWWGSIYIAKNKKIIYKYGLDTNEIVFMRSLAKPLQSLVLCDTNIISDYSLTDKELAIFCGSHAGSSKHIEVLKGIKQKFNIKISELELVAQTPLDTRKFIPPKTKLHNNCSGKHLMMLSACKYMDFDTKNYTNPNHPLQKLIKEKQDNFSGYKSDILTFDGCSTPLWGLPVRNLLKAYFNYFQTNNAFINAILKEPYIYGGYDRLDTEIIQKSKRKLFAKVGAGGFILIYNFKEDMILLIKLAQNNNHARKLITYDILNKLNWYKSDIEEYEYNQKNQKVAKYCYEFSV